MRSELIERMARNGIEDGALALLAGVSAAIEACEAAAEAPADVVKDGRAVLSDDGTAITLMMYGTDGTRAAVILAPLRAVALAHGRRPAISRLG